MPDSSSTMKRSPVPDWAASSVCVQPRILRFSRMAAPKSREDLNIERLLRRLTVQEDLSQFSVILTDREALTHAPEDRPDRKVSGLIRTSKNEVLEIRVSHVVHLRVSQIAEWKQSLTGDRGFAGIAGLFGGESHPLRHHEP
ncbi:hypothetical protein AGR4B_Lc70142 [Agrobacterium tumefaciens str. CFBP 5621]|nr:hypothetical protein AGR4B_Lc70142 [Agrobacterium tumefaciens str. CFBP 5621]